MNHDTSNDWIPIVIKWDELNGRNAWTVSAIKYGEILDTRFISYTDVSHPTLVNEWIFLPYGLSTIPSQYHPAKKFRISEGRKKLDSSKF